MNQWNLLIVAEEDTLFRQVSSLLPGSLVERASSVEQARDLLLNGAAASAETAAAYDALLVCDRRDGCGCAFTGELTRRGYPAPVLVLAAEDNPTLDQAAQEAGAAAYLALAELSPAVLARAIRWATRSRNHRIDTPTPPAQPEPTEETRQALLQQKRELERINQTLQGMFDHAPAGLAMFDAQPPYQVLASNLVYQRIWPEPFYTAGLVGRYLTDYIPQAEDFGVLEVFREVAATGVGKTIYHFPFDGLPGGRTWWDWDLSPVFEEGRLTAFVLVAIDVTSEVKARKRLEQELTVRQRFEEALWASENRLRRLIDSNMIGIFYADLEGRVTDGNEAFLQTTGYTREDLLSGAVNWKAMTPEEFAPQDERSMAEARENGACTPYEKEFQRKDGSRVPILLGYALFEGSSDFICFLLDLSERKEAEDRIHHYAAELERSNRDLQDFAFIASHDLQEPLRKINAFGSRLEEKFKGQVDGPVDEKSLEEALDYIQRMRRAAQRMQTMIDDLLAYSRVSTRVQPFALVDLTALAQEVLGDLEMRIEQTGGRVELGSLPEIEADRNQIRHLLQNLIGNALKFHRPGVPPLVQVSACRLPRGWVELVVADNGIGFSDEHAERIFQPFQRLHGRSEYEGSGIGLAICRKIVERHGGEIRATAEPSAGSRFIVKLPVKQKKS